MKSQNKEPEEDANGSSSDPEISFLVFDESPTNLQNPQDTMLAQKFWKQFELEPQMESKLVAMDRVNQSSRHTSHRKDCGNNNRKNSANSVRSTPMVSQKMRSSSNLRPDSVFDHQTGGASALDQSSNLILQQQRRDLKERKERQQAQKQNQKPGSSQARLRKYQKPTKPTSNNNNTSEKTVNISEMVRQLKSNSSKFQNKPKKSVEIQNISADSNSKLEDSKNYKNGNLRVTNSNSINFNQESYAHEFDDEADIQEMERELAQLDAFEVKQGLCS